MRVLKSLSRRAQASSKIAVGRSQIVGPRLNDRHSRPERRKQPVRSRPLPFLSALRPLRSSLSLGDVPKADVLRGVQAAGMGWEADCQLLDFQGWLADILSVASMRILHAAA